MILSVALLKASQPVLCFFFFLFLQSTVFFPYFRGPSLRSGAVDSLYHSFDSLCCSVSHRHVGQNLKTYILGTGNVHCVN